MTNEYSRMAPTNEADLITQSTHPLAERCKTREWHPSRSQRWLVNSTRTWCKLSEIWSRHDGKKYMRENFPSSKELSKQATERRDKFLTTPWPKPSVFTSPPSLMMRHVQSWYSAGSNWRWRTYLCSKKLKTKNCTDHGSTRIYTDEFLSSRNVFVQQISLIAQNYFLFFRKSVWICEICERPKNWKLKTNPIGI